MDARIRIIIIPTVSSETIVSTPPHMSFTTARIEEALKIIVQKHVESVRLHAEMLLVS